MTSDKATINTLIIMHKEQIVVVEHICCYSIKQKQLRKSTNFQNQQTGLLSAASTLEASTSCG
jgi:hypothetical protein